MQNGDQRTTEVPTRVPILARIPGGCTPRAIPGAALQLLRRLSPHHAACPCSGNHGVRAPALFGELPRLWPGRSQPERSRTAPGVPATRSEERPWSSDPLFSVRSEVELDHQAVQLEPKRPTGFDFEGSGDPVLDESTLTGAVNETDAKQNTKMVGQPADIHFVLDGEFRHCPRADNEFLNQADPERVGQGLELLDGPVPGVISVLRHGEAPALDRERPETSGVEFCAAEVDSATFCPGKHGILRSGKNAPSWRLGSSPYSEWKVPSEIVDAWGWRIGTIGRESV